MIYIKAIFTIVALLIANISSSKVKSADNESCHIIDEVDFNKQYYVQLPELNKSIDLKSNYYIDRNYIFTGILRHGREDLCETGISDDYLYIQILPIDIIVDDEETLNGMTQLQITGVKGVYLWDKIGSEITISGDLVLHVTSCHTHTDVYLINVEVKDIKTIPTPLTIH